MNLAKIHQLMLRKKEFPISLPREGFKDQAELAKILFYFIVFYFIFGRTGSLLQHAGFL